MRATIFASCLLLLATMGCQSVKDAYVGTIPIANAIVEVETPDGQSTPIGIRSSLNENSRTGVKHFETQEWQKGVDALILAVEAKPSDHRSQFALGLGYEKLGKFEDALAHYKKAIFHTSSNDIVYDASRRRVQLKMGSGASR